MPPHVQSNRWLPWLVAGALAVMVFALRWPTFDFRVWNVDEAIHAAVARTLLDGGVLYRDAIDQRTPLSYYAVALLFRAAGENNIWAMHALAALLIAGTAFGLFLIGRRWRGDLCGLWAALLFTVFSSALLYPGDAYALNTEWFVAFFTTWAAWSFWRGSNAGAGAWLGLAFLSKQPALLDLCAPLAVVVYCAWHSVERVSRVATRLASVLAGFAAPVLLVACYFARCGALGDFYFYAWQYNLRYYAPEIGQTDRLLTALKPLHLLGTQYPLALAAFLGALGYGIYRVMQARPTTAELADNPKLGYLLVWSGTSLAGAAAGGRGYDHYFIQFLPACCLAMALGLAGITRWARTHRLKQFLLPAAILWSAALLVQLGQGLLAASRQPRLPVDPSKRAGEFIREHTREDERIFVWGYHPDIYLFAERKPASRFVYGSFLTGLIPWTNIAPEKDTTYAIVPGTRDSLLHELDAIRPAFIVDCSAGPNRFWNKYPLATFPQLRDFLDKNYVLAEPAEFAGQGFQLYLIQDSARRMPLRPAGGPVAQLGVPQVFVSPVAGNQQYVEVAFAGTSANRRLQRLELLHNDAVVAAASFPPTGGLMVKCKLSLAQLGKGEHRLAARATGASGETVLSPATNLRLEPGSIPPDQLKDFVLPHLAEPLPPVSGYAAFGASVEFEAGQPIFYAHAPSTLTYRLAGDGVRLHGNFGFRPGAYDSTNLNPTDGAEFQIVLLQPDGTQLVLFRRLLEPVKNTGDRGPQPLLVKLPEKAQGLLQLVITNGPAGSATSDWTYWSNLLLETSH